MTNTANITYLKYTVVNDDKDHILEVKGYPSRMDIINPPLTKSGKAQSCTLEVYIKRTNEAQKALKDYMSALNLDEEGLKYIIKTEKTTDEKYLPKNLPFDKFIKITIRKTIFNNSKSSLPTLNVLDDEGNKLKLELKQNPIAKIDDEVWCRFMFTMKQNGEYINQDFASVVLLSRVPETPVFCSLDEEDHISLDTESDEVDDEVPF